MQRVGVQHQRHRGIGLLRMVIAAFEPAIGAGEHDFGHRASVQCLCCGRARRAPPANWGTGDRGNLPHVSGNLAHAGARAPPR